VRIGVVVTVKETAVAVWSPVATVTARDAAAAAEAIVRSARAVVELVTVTGPN
jgi:hypothetical protein